MSLKSAAQTIDKTAIPICKGTVTAAHEHIIEARIPGMRIGTRVTIFPINAPPVPAEAASFNGADVRLYPLDDSSAVGPGDKAITEPLGGNIFCGMSLLGRIIDALGRPIDERGPLSGTHPWALCRPAPPALTRRPVERRLVTGIRVIDGCLALGYGQRIGLFAGAGLGKSTLLGMLAERADVDVNVICLVGERGREVNEFINDSLGPAGLQRSVVVVAPADAPPMARVRSLDTATAAAEWFRARGLKVLLLVDSLTRVVRAKREAAFALGDPPARDGFPASAFSFLPGLIERAGCDRNGSISAVYSVLTENHANDPVAEEARSLMDGHIVLSEKRARAGQWPAVDLLRSVSRVHDKLVPDDILNAAARLKRMQSAYEENEDLILMGAYKKGASKATDAAIKHKDAVLAFLNQRRGETSSPAQTFEALKNLAPEK